MAKLITRGIGYAAGTDRVVIDDGDVSINGISLGALTVGASGVLSADDVKSWIDLADSGVGVQAHNVIEIPKEGLRLDAGAGLQINGYSIPSVNTESLTRFTSDDDLLSSINALTEQTGVFAQKLNSGNFILRNNNLGGANIVIGGSSSGLGGNALGITSKSYIGNISMALESEDGDSIRLDLGTEGKPSDLNLLGLDTQIRLSGEIDEDLLVFVTGSGQSQLTAASSDSGVTVADGLRSRQIEFEFVASDRYRVRDLRTETVLAERSYGGELALDYQGIQVTLDNPAKIGDSFVLDGNNLGPNGSFDAQGNNVNILRLIDLESKGVLDGGLTLTEGYLGFVGDVGNLTTQSSIAHDALKIVQAQAVEARDRVSGVNLDKEAADLIRFQQAYQASAQVMQVATRLFDTMLQIR
jgi:flagellar hook-associated protein FlgK